MYTKLKFAILACHKSCVAQIEWLELLNHIEDSWLDGNIREREHKDLKNIWDIAYLSNARALRLML